MLLFFVGIRYNASVPLPQNGWQVAPRPQPWYPQPPAVSVPPPSGLGYAQQPLFPVQAPLPSTTSPGLPASMHPVPVSQPLFPVVGVNNLPTQSSPYSAPMLSTNIPSNPLGSMDAYQGARTSNPSSYHVSNIPGLISLYCVIYLVMEPIVVSCFLFFFFQNNSTYTQSKSHK